MRDSMINMKKEVGVLWIETIRVQVPWYMGKREKDFRVLRNEAGVPLDVVDPNFTKFWGGLRALCESTGVKLVHSKVRYREMVPMNCRRCGEFFFAKRTTAQFCEECRVSHDRRKEEDPLYEEKNRDRARKGMERYRHGSTKSQNRKGRKQGNARRASAGEKNWLLE
jgi:hypothetical protein